MKLLLIVLTALFLVGCGNGNASFADEKGNVSNPNASRSESTSPPAQYFAKIKDGETTVAYVVDLYRGYATVYLLDTKVYAQIDVSTSQYVEVPESKTGRIYFSGTNCSGTGYIEEFEGEVGSSVIKASNGNFYSIDERADYRNTTLTHNSYLDYRGDCRNASSNIYGDTKLAKISMSSEPYDFSQIAPVAVYYE